MSTAKNEPPKELIKTVEDICVALKKDDYVSAAAHFDSSVSHDKSKMKVINYIKKEKPLLSFLCDEIKSVKYEQKGKEWTINLQEDNELYFGLKENKWKFLKRVNLNEE